MWSPRTQLWCWVGDLPLSKNLTIPSIGRVARAGRSGTAYSLVAPDELPYLLDLHLFLGRSLALAYPSEEPAGEWRAEGMEAGHSLSRLWEGSEFHSAAEPWAQPLLWLVTPCFQALGVNCCGCWLLLSLPAFLL